MSCSRPVFDADHVHAHVGQDLRDGQGMAQVRLARNAQLAGVILRGEL
jgi:hypothetical protein